MEEEKVESRSIGRIDFEDDDEEEEDKNEYNNGV